MFIRLIIICLSIAFVTNTFSALNVELSVKECAGVGSDGYPIRTVVPIPKGFYQNTSSFRLTDASGVTVPAQFEILSRRYLGDQSITNIAITYLPTVSAFSGAGTGIAKYYLKDDGPGSFSTALSVVETADLITVTTGNSLKFTVKKIGFNILNEVWYDPSNGSNFNSSNLVVKPNENSGGEFIGRLTGDLQLDADRTDIKVEIEEEGPVYTVIRAEAVTKYYSPSNHTHGWAVRIFAYAGKSHIKVDYQLQNSSKTKKYSWPLYFNALNFNLDLNLSGALSVKSGLGNGSVYSGSLGSGVLLAQKHDSLFNIYGVDGTGDTTTVLGTGGRPDGFVTVDNGVIGVTVKTRNFWQMYPNGIKIDQNQKLSVQLFPEWSCQIDGARRNPTFTPTHLYWLADMQHVYKEVVINFHQSTSDNELRKFSKTVDYHPVASLPVSYVGSAGSSLDLEGLIPFTTKISTTDSRIPSNPSATRLGWYYYVLNGRRTETAQAGGIPQGGGQFWTTENPADWFEAERELIGEMNIRPQWMAQYSFKDDFSFLKLGMNNGTNAPRFDPSMWRDEDMGADLMDSAVLAETKGSGMFTIGYASCIDNAHYWHHHIKDYYWITGNHWQRDYYKFIVEFRKNLTAGFPTIARHGGHPLADAFQALQITGDTTMKRLFKENMLNNRDAVRPQFGDYNTMCCGEFGTAPWEMGFGARPVIDYMTHLDYQDVQMHAESFQLISAYLHWNLHYGNFGYRAYSPQRQNSYIGSFTVLDPQAWYYWNTGKREFLDHALMYINTGITVVNGVGDGSKPLTASGSSNWTGDYAGRWIQYVRNNARVDTIPPAAIQNAVMERSGSSCTVRWTVPTDAKRYHIVWGTKPLVYNQTDDSRYLNWWAAKTVGKALTSAAGAQDQVSFTVPATGLVFAAIFTFDSASNMSGFSNVATSDLTQASAPLSLTANVVNAQKITLSWGASSDPESGVWYYNIYRNGLLVATTDKLTYDDNGLVESTSYSYAVAAVSGSNVEGIRAELSGANTPADTEAPYPVSAISVSVNPVVTVVFSEPLDPLSAQNVSNYSINNSISITSAVLQPDNKTVILACSPMQYLTSYVVTINGVKDLAVTPNSVSNANITFTHREPLVITNTRPTEYIWTQFTTDVDVYIDQSTKMAEIPTDYQNLPLLRCGSMYSKYYARNDSIIAFTSNKALKVYLMMDKQQTARPAWLTSNFTPNGDTINNSFIVWERTYPAGRVRIPGGNLSENYGNFFIVVEPLDSSWVSFAEDDISTDEYSDNLITYPNPFNPVVSIFVQVAKESAGKLPDAYIYDISGRVVEKLLLNSVNARGNSRQYLYSWNAVNKASGIYFVHVRTNNREYKKRIIYTR
jgi:hypothetical protein